MTTCSRLKRILPGNSIWKHCTLCPTPTGARKLFFRLIFVCLLILIVSILQIHPSNYLLFRSKPMRICCLILTAPKNFIDRAKAVNQTWGPRCDKYYFITEKPKNSSRLEHQIGRQLPIAPIKGIIKGYGHLTKKSSLALLFAYKTHRNDFDWFVKADDDTYIVMENLRAFLQEQKSSEPVTFGFNFRSIVPGGYHSGGASYVLSREALKRFYHGFTKRDKNGCARDKGYEDVEIAKCLRKQGVYTGKALDKYDRELFHPLRFHDLFSGNAPNWMRLNAENPVRQHYNCCSQRTISFHYMHPNDQYFMDFLLYQVGALKTTEPGYFKKFNVSARRMQAASQTVVEWRDSADSE